MKTTKKVKMMTNSQVTSIAPRTHNACVEVRAHGDDGIFEGYGSVFGVKDSYDEIVAPGAFSASLDAHRAEKRMPAMLWQHDPYDPIGVYTEMREDERGLFVKGQLVLEAPKGKTAHALLNAGALDGLSIGFMPKKSNYDEDTKTRTLTEIDLWEVSLVTFPANEAARVEGVKAMLADIHSLSDAERFLRDAGFSSRAEATAIVSRIRDIVLNQRDADRAMAELKASTDRVLEILSI